MCQALAMGVLGPGIRVFGDGPDGGREASFDSQLRYPTPTDPWDGYGVLQVKYKTTIVGTGADTAWLRSRIKAELDAWANSDNRRVKDGRSPRYLIVATNVALSSVPGRGGKDRIDELIGSYADVLGLKGWRVWDATQLATYLDGNEDVRRAFAGLITPGDVLSSLHDRLTAPLQANVHVIMPAARIRPGQPGQEPAFQAAYDDAGGASRLGEATTEVDQDGPGWVQHFDGGASGESAVLCALPGEPAVAVAGSVWHALCAIGRGTVGGGIVGVGFPAVDPTGQRPYIGSEHPMGAKSRTS